MKGRQEQRKKILQASLKVLLIVAVFLFSVDLMGEAFKYIGEKAAESLIFATKNPFIGLFLGLLITAIIQSSSTSTAMIVALVASGSITIADSVPMIMGANIGTTLTSTIVSLGFITKKNEFRKAIATGTVHDFFNILVVLLLFPLEYYYGFVSSTAQGITSLVLPSGCGSFSGGAGFKLFDAIPLTSFLISVINNSFISIILSFVLLFASIKLLSSLIYKLVIGESQGKLRNYIFSNPFKSFFWGAAFTAGVQSSSITTSLMVPFVATRKISLESAMPFILGANIGTTITAFIAVLLESNAAISIAVTHLLLNTIGVLVFLPFKYLRMIPIKLAMSFGRLTMNYRLAGIGYILFTFFIAPFTLIYFNRNATKITELTYIIEENQTKKEKKVISVAAQDKRYGSLWGSDVNLSNKGYSENIMTIYRNNDVLFLNDRFYLIKKEGFCWDDQDTENRKYQMCISQILPSVKHGDISADSVFVFKKTFYDPVDRDSSYFYYQISVSNKLLLSAQKFTNHGKLLRNEQLTRIDVK
ncbi:MAG: Na/Pi symporter [Bacteroidota bacterium]